mmetsp:Transcript_30465/g.46134  ORF Transcript_30465/g.46134 Transcript_30465/m.46134 type:complete len:229 (-) Transcript_30465:281-967(-)|eukprot:CAMPEP_0178898610 /NCGR_PEP_ID=MMETSP0786-20121207/2435_1 /TAXON_ID=186022 /ORGANISM="Thalassionema frauenfeldii, Strain CCMP 1798" /LENGTH=228 /DNA_ID=CAMNT_0020569365 /DNA_START=43 /DNA_END=729 /DNA_ORIENTATION=+
MIKVCPVSLSLFITSATAFTWYLKRQRSRLLTAVSLPQCQVVFVLGGPGAGKGTQCQLLKERMGWSHLSAGDLLRAERKRKGPTADLINSKIASGQIVPAEITVGLLQQGMEAEHEATGCTKFLIDGFPRSQGNVDVWNSNMDKHRVEFVLNLSCPEEVLVGRLLERGETSGRTDDNIDVIRKRFKTFQEECKPIVEMYERENRVRNIASDQSVEDVYQEVAALFQNM